MSQSSRFPATLLLWVCFCLGIPWGALAQITDPAPPVVATVPAMERPQPQAFDRLTFHQAARPLSPTAKTSDWLRFLGPQDDATSPETELAHAWPEKGPPLLWEMRKGDGYTSPAIMGDSLVFFHALDGQEIIECLHPESGQRYWSYQYPVEYQDRFGYANGPRGSPVIADGRVLTLGVTSVLSCLDLKSGQLLWQRDLRAEFDVPQEFFGYGSTPLVQGGRVIINVGGRSPQLCVGAFDLATGKLLWGVEDEWGASYASPIPARLHGQDTVMVFAGGESDPAVGGLLCLDPVSGQVYDRVPWRAKHYISVNATSPVIVPDQHGVFISTAYPKGRPLGGALFRFDEKLKAEEVWRSAKFAIHWMNPVLHEGYLYGIDGETERQAELVCVEAATGQEMWRQDLLWDDAEMGGGRPAKMGIQRASLLHVDGRFLCLGENGTLLWLDLSPTGCQVQARAQLFYAPHTWCLPVVSRGLLYVTQNYEEQVRGKTGLRLLCYDLRAVAAAPPIQKKP